MNPVLKKDLLGTLRLKRSAAVLLSFILVLALTLLAGWPQRGVVSLASQAQDSLMLGLMLGQTILLILFVPGLAATSLVAERENGSLEMLYASRLSPGQIIIGKTMAAIGFPIILLVSGLPFVGLLAWRGDVRIADLILSYAILVESAVFLAVVSLVVSAYTRQSATAILVSYIIVMVVAGASLVPAAIMLDTADATVGSSLHLIRGISPVAAIMSVLRPAWSDVGGTRHQLPPIWQLFCVTGGIVVAVGFGLISMRLRRPPNETDASNANRSQPVKPRRPFGAINPILGKESRTSSLRSTRWIIRIFYASLVLSLGLALMSLFGGSEHEDLLIGVAQILVAFEIGLVLFIAPSLTSPSISTELESGTFETLRMTRLGAGSIFLGKFLPGSLVAMLPSLALLPGFGAICYVDNTYIPRFVAMIPLIGVAVVFCASIGMFCSCLIANTARATVVSYIVCAFFVALPMLAWWLSPAPIPLETAKWLAMVSPLAVALNMLPDGNSIADLYGIHLAVLASCAGLLLLLGWYKLRVLIQNGNN